ncbi:M14 family metallopeptidase [Magnetofaba australis]|uniref:Putative succinylglutamate desuccinylase/aspartoacylase n=1 Tax=Magnetofaba australis IT-1 TaxID=1434232 RepID=A0A1Y2K714_9PROT|nr:M14 family metallopeptidase [Magnetofaba australis]OSM05148.1 putative succinylglutamate desuccinylase/aspartoacylase [Magnetofaba australis IT-1]
MLQILDAIPDGLLQTPAAQLAQRLGGPTLIHLRGRRNKPIFISVLLHGDETTGWSAVRTLLAEYQNQELPRAISLFIGNVDAAAAGVRRLPEQPDYNRIWRGDDDAPEQRMARTVWEEMRQREAFLCVDIHNNTSRNPHYACVNRLDAQSLQLAALFAPRAVYFIRPETALSLAFSELCPAVTLECGQAGAQAGVDHALAFLRACLEITRLPTHPPADDQLTLLHAAARIRVPDEFSLGFGPGCDAQICFPRHMDEWNFQELGAGVELGRVSVGDGAHILVEDENGASAFHDYLHVHEGRIVTRIPVIPAMLSVEERAVRLDCLGYLMARLPLPEADAVAKQAWIPNEESAGDPAILTSM